MVRNMPYTQKHRFQKGTVSLTGPAVLGAVSEKKPRQPAALSLVYLNPPPLFKENFSESGDSFSHRDWKALEAVPGSVQV